MTPAARRRKNAAHGLALNLLKGRKTCVGKPTISKPGNGGRKRRDALPRREKSRFPGRQPRYCPAPAAAILFTATFRRNSAASSGRTVLMNIPEPNSKLATRVSRGITLTYQ